MNRNVLIRLIWVVFLFLPTLGIAQESSTTAKQKVVTLNVDCSGMNFSDEHLGNISRMELEKLGIYEVMDKYDVQYLAGKHSLKTSDCFGKLCLLEIGRILKADKMFTGSIEQFNKVITVNYRLIDVATETIEKNFIKEYQYLPEDLKVIIQVSIREMFDLPNDPQLVKNLTIGESQQMTIISNPYVERLNLSGPRMGFTMYTGNTAEILKDKEYMGGFDAYPYMFQFGFQFEKQYLNEGKFQALFEFIPMLTGMDQGFFIPSFTILNGLRNNKSGLEFAFGPSFNLSPTKVGYYDSNNIWTLKDANTPVGTPTISRLDSRGSNKLHTSFVVGLGKTFKSGRLNIPFNLFFIPGKDGARYGFSFGFNSRKSKS